jgi:hypothetical protein
LTLRYRHFSITCWPIFRALPDTHAWPAGIYY